MATKPAHWMRKTAIFRPKQLFPKHFERLRMVLLGHENWDDMVQRVESVTTAGDDIDDPKLYASGNSAPRGQGGHPK